MSNFGYNVLGFGANASTSTGPSDDQFNRVSFKSSFEGTNNGVNNVFDDGSASNHTITTAGNVTQGSFGPFARPDGEWGVSFDGDSDYLQFAESSDFAFGTGDFTFECFFFMKDAGTYDYLMTFGNNTNADSIGLYIQTGLVKVYNGGVIVDAGSTTVTLNTWHHVAVVRISSTLAMYLDGNQVHSVSNSSNIASTGGANIARWGLISDGQYFNGVISNARVVKGTGVYTGNFTPSTSKLTAITNTKLLTCQSNRFLDNSASGHTVTPYATSAITAFGPFLTSAVYDPAVNGASAEFGTVSDFLALPANSLNLGTNNFTIETWVYTSSTAQQLIVGSCVGSNGYGSYMFNINYNSDKVRFFCRYAGGNVLSYTVESGSFPINSWNHLAATRDSANLRVFINGTQAGSTNTTLSNSAIDAPRGGQNTQGTTAVYYVGKTSDGSLPIIGSLCDLRVIVGTAVYTSNFTSPTAPLAAITNTKLLLNMADGQAIDSAAQNILTLFGNAKLSTSQAKFGDTSLLLDGTGDFAQAANFEDLAGPFTIECFARADDTGNAFLWCLGQYRLELGINGNTLRIYRIGTSTGYTNFFTGGEFSANNWHHVALVRDANNVIKCYLNGTASSTTVTDATAFVATNNILIIGGEAEGAPSGGAINLGWDGYVDDFRVSRFARYTSNFTAPSEPFADKGQ